MNSKAYLSRISCDNITLKTDLASLSHIQQQHLKTIPYENLDIMRGKPLSMKIDDIYEKIINNQRGGYCFELNGLYAWLLRSLGFKVRDCMGRWLQGEEGIPMRRHRVLVVSCDDGDYLCDVGVGRAIPQKPIPMTLNKIIEQGKERYKLESEPFLGFVLYEWKHNEWQRMYSFTTEEQIDVDYVATSFWCENYPGSYFRSMNMVHIFTDVGRKAIADRELRIYTPDNVEVIVAATEAIFAELIEQHFNIKYQ